MAPHSGVAQLAEQRTVNALVVGSTPTPRARTETGAPVKVQEAASAETAKSVGQTRKLDRCMPVVNRGLAHPHPLLAAASAFARNENPLADMTFRRSNTNSPLTSESNEVCATCGRVYSAHCPYHRPKHCPNTCPGLGHRCTEDPCPYEGQDWHEGEPCPSASSDTSTEKTPQEA